MNEIGEETGDCCKQTVSESQTTGCPECGNAGHPVRRITVSVMAKSPEFYLHPESLPVDDFYFCETATCPVVYFNLRNHMVLNKSDIRLKVWQKEENRDGVPVCYCFNNTISSIRAEILDIGKSDVLQRISKEVKAGNCRCEVTNPQGSCCMGNVAKAIKLAEAKLEKIVFTG